MHQVLYNGINAFHGAIPAFLNMPYKPTCHNTTVIIKNSKAILIVEIYNADKSMIFNELKKRGSWIVIISLTVLSLVNKGSRVDLF